MKLIYERGAVMEEKSMKVYKYRWVILLVYALINVVIQMQWLTFASTADIAQSVYKVSPLKIDFLSMIYMIVYIIACIPESYIIDTYGIRKGIGIGAVLTGIFGLMKGLYADNYTIVCIAQTGLAIAQPFIINSVTKVGVNWFPIEERATEAGVASLCQYIGIIFAMIVTPMLITKVKIGNMQVYSLNSMLMFYGVLSVISAALVLIFMKECPPTPPSKESTVKRLKTFEGIQYIFKQKDMILLIIIFFIGLGMFNAVSTCIDQICKLKSLSSAQIGIVGGVMIIGGIIGACVVPVLSDKMRKRKTFLFITLLLMTPGLIGLTFVKGYTGTMISSFVFGFFLMSAAPIGFQYSAELSYPAPESTSQGIILLVGQISGIVFVLGINSAGAKTSMIIFTILSILNIVFSLIIKESPLILQEKNKSSQGSLSV